MKKNLVDQNRLHIFVRQIRYVRYKKRETRKVY